jgi:hypothetical protein
MSDELVMNPFVDIHVHPAPEAFPIDVARIEVISVKCPVRGRGLVIRELTRLVDPQLFAFFAGLVANHGELALDSDAPLVSALIDIGFLVLDDDIVDWPQFRVPLDDAPAAAPAPDGRWIVSPTLLFQPSFALHPGVRWPADYDEQDGRLRCFAPGPAFWLGAPDQLVSPFWLSADAAALVAELVPGAPPPALPPELARSLAHAGALHPVDRPPASPLAAFARHHAAYGANGYVVARDLLSAGELAALRRYYAALLAAGLVQLGDRQNAERYSSYNDPIGRFLHARLTRAMSTVVGQPVDPSFSYLFSYLAGAALEPHRDRAQAEFSITLQIDHTPEPAAETGWPLCFTFEDGRTAAANLRIGDAVLYHGRALTHYRGPLGADQRSSVLVLEYVPHDFHGLRI